MSFVVRPAMDRISGGKRRMNMGYRRCICENCCCLFVFSMVLAMAAAGALGAPAAKKLLAVPTEAQRAQALRLVRDIYKTQYADHTPAGGKKLAETLLKDAAATQDDAVARYVMLCEAREAAGDAGEMNLSLRAMATLADQFKVDSAGLELDTVRRVGRSAAGVKNAGDLAEMCLTLAGITSRNKPSVAQTFCDLAEQAAQAAKNRELMAAANAVAGALRSLAVEERKGEAALVRLKTHPDDKAASTAAGRYLCLVRGDWAGGLPLLADGNGGVPGLREAAAKDIAHPTTAADRMALAEAYWHLSE